MDAEDTNPNAERPPSGKRASRREATHRRILSAAERLFAEQGESGLSMRALADAVELSPAALYKYFQGKEELVDALRDAFFEGFIERLETSLAMDDPLAGLRSGLAAYIHCALERPYHYLAAFASDVRAHARHGKPGSDNPMLKGTERMEAYDILHAKLEVVAKSRGVDGLDYEAAADSLWASVHGMAMILINVVEVGADARDAMIREHVKFIVNGIFPTARA